MTSSGIKRGIATSAISALAVAGLPLFAGTAAAVSNASQYDADEVQLLSQFSGVASVKNDGTNTTVRLSAGAGSDVSQVTFQYNTGNPDTWVTIATVDRNDDGAFSHEWDATALAGATGIQVRALSVNATTTDPDAADARTVDIQGGGGATASVNLADGSAKGAFQEPYTGDASDSTWVSLSGTSSAQTGTVDLHHFYKSTGADGEPNAATGSATLVDGAFTGAIDVEGYDFTGTPDELSFAAVNGSDDVESYSLYIQQIAAVSAVADDTNVPDGESATVTVTVTDQNGQPIAGAEVIPSNPGVTDPDVRYTDANGQATFEQTSGTTYYYANATDGEAYEPGVGDQRSEDVSVSEFAPTPTSLEASSADGAAFDDDEYATGDITVQVKNQNGGDADTNALQELNYHWVITPFDGSAQVRVPATGESSETGETDGSYTVDFPTGEESGTYELYASLSEVPLQGGGAIAESKVLTVKAGQSKVVYDEASPETAPAGGEEEVTGKLVLEDGTGLGDRGLDFNYTGGTDAAIEESSGTANDGILRTGADGGFAFVVDDPAVTAPAAQPTERGTLTVDPVAVDNGPGTGTDSVGDVGPDTQEVVFAADAAPAGSTIAITEDNAEARPGEAQTVTVKVDGDPNTDGVQGVPNTEVDLTVDQGFFTNSTAAADFGQAITVVTDSNGVATAYVTIRRNEGFDDNGKVTSTVTASSGAATDTEGYEWNSANPLNGGTVDLVFSDFQTVDVLPLAPFETEDVNLDVFVYDEFGNPVAGEDVTISDNTELAQTEESDGDPAVTIESNLGNDVDFVATADAVVDQTITATWEDSYTNNANPPVTTDLTDSESINWYAIDVADVRLTHSGTDPQPVGSTVTMTYKAVDQHGEPIKGYGVRFFRAGPDDEGDGDGNSGGATNELGEVYYVFQGESAGEADVSAVLYDTEGTLVPEGETRDTVTFGSDADVRDITAKLTGRNNGARADRLKVKAPRVAADAKVKLFKVKRNGDKVRLKTRRLNDRGDKFFRVKDRNGRKRTQYVAVVKRTDDTTRAKTNRRKIR